MSASRVLIVYTDEVGSSTYHETAKPDDVVRAVAHHFSAVLLAADIDGVTVIKNVGDSLVIRFSPGTLLDLVSRFAELRATLPDVRIGMHAALTEELVIDQRIAELKSQLVEDLQRHMQPESGDRPHQSALRLLGDRWPDWEKHLATDIFGHDMNYAARISNIPHAAAFVVSQAVYDGLAKETAEHAEIVFPNSALDDPATLNQHLRAHGFLVSMPLPVIHLKGLQRVSMTQPEYVYEICPITSTECGVSTGQVAVADGTPTRGVGSAARELAQCLPSETPVALEYKTLRMLYWVELHSSSTDAFDQHACSHYAQRSILPQTISLMKGTDKWQAPHPTTVFIDHAFEILGVYDLDMRRAKELELDLAIRDGVSVKAFDPDSGVLPCFLLAASFPDNKSETVFRDSLQVRSSSADDPARQLDLYSMVRSYEVWGPSYYDSKAWHTVTAQLATTRGLSPAPTSEYWGVRKVAIRATMNDRCPSECVIIFFRLTSEAARNGTTPSAVFSRLTWPERTLFRGSLLCCGLLRGALDGYLIYSLGATQDTRKEHIERVLKLRRNANSFVGKDVDMIRLTFVRLLAWDRYREDDVKVLSRLSEQAFSDGLLSWTT